MISLEQLHNISSIPTASWALWNESGSSDLAFFSGKLDLLHGRVMVLGLNRSNGAHAQVALPFINFHTPKHRGDRRLRRYIQDGNLDEILGAYMTDISVEVQTDSNKVKISNPKAALDELSSQLSFSREPRRTVICMGDKTFDTLCLGLGLKGSTYESNLNFHNLRMAEAKWGNEHWSIYRVWLHSSYGRFQRYGEEELPRQLIYINDRIKASRLSIESTAMLPY